MQTSKKQKLYRQLTKKFCTNGKLLIASYSFESKNKSKYLKVWYQVFNKTTKDKIIRYNINDFKEEEIEQMIRILMLHQYLYNYDLFINQQYDNSDLLQDCNLYF